MAAEIKVGVLLRLVDQLSGPSKKAAQNLARNLGAAGKAGGRSGGVPLWVKESKAREAEARRLQKAQRSIRERQEKALAADMAQQVRRTEAAERAKVKIVEREERKAAQIRKRWSQAGLTGAGPSGRTGSDRRIRDMERLRVAERRRHQDVVKHIREEDRLRNKRPGLRNVVRQEINRGGGAGRGAFATAGNLSLAANNFDQIGRRARGFLEAPIRRAAVFEAKMANVGIVTKANAKELEKLTAQARVMGAGTIFSATQAAEGQEFLGMAGFGVQKIMDALPAVLDLAAAKTMDLGVAADITTNIMTPFGLKASDMVNVADAITAATADANINVIELGEAMKMVAPGASQAKIAMEPMVAMTGLLGDAGIKGTFAGTALRKMLLSMQAPSKSMAKLMKGMGEETKKALETQDFSNIAGVMEEIGTALEGMDPEKAIQFSKDLFGIRALGPAKKLIADIKSGNFATKLAEVHRGEKEGAAKSAADIQRETTIGKLKEARSKFESLQIELGKNMIPVLVELLEATGPVITGMAKWAKANPGLVKNIAKTVAAVGLASVGFGAIARIGSGVATIFGVGGKLIGGISAMGNAAKNARAPILGLKGVIGGGNLGLIGAAAAAGLAIGAVADRMFGISDKLAGVNKESDKFRVTGGHAALGNLTQDERLELAGAKNKLVQAKEDLTGEHVITKGDRKGQIESTGALAIGNLLTEFGVGLFTDADDRLEEAQSTISRLNKLANERAEPQQVEVEVSVRADPGTTAKVTKTKTKTKASGPVPKLKTTSTTGGEA